MNYRKSPARPIVKDERRRTFTDADGTFWDVREVDAPDYDRRGSRCLIFESLNSIRRVRNYPPDWYELSEERLGEISFQP